MVKANRVKGVFERHLALNLSDLDYPRNPNLAYSAGIAGRFKHSRKIVAHSDHAGQVA